MIGRLSALVRAILCAALLTGLFSAAASAHDARPVSVTIRELPAERYAFRIRAPESVPLDNLPQIVAPEGCEAADIPQENAPALTASTVLSCPGGLAGRAVELQWPIYNPSLSTLYRLQPLEGAPLSRLLAPSDGAWTVPAEPARFGILKDYMLLGIDHIAGGLDHLLFVAGLLLVAGTVRRMLIAITGFTLAHSITLALSTLDLVRLPAPPVEAAIALSILFLAIEIVRGDRNSLAFRHPGWIACLFGLLHGFGFAGVLRDIGVPQGEIATALLSFNVGVELGQLAFIALLLALGWLWARIRPRFQTAAPQIAAAPMLLVAGYVLGTISTFWLIERLSTFA